MKYMNVVKFKVKLELMSEFQQKMNAPRLFDGQINEYFVQTGECDFVGVGIWESEEKMIAARPAMIRFLDSIRHTLEQLSPELGVTDAVSGKVVFER